jgi:hypothetical protein
MMAKSEKEEEILDDWTEIIKISDNDMNKVLD